MHTMQEEGGEHHELTTNGYAGGAGYGGGAPPHNHAKQLSMRDTLLSAVGMLLPLLAQLGHAH